MIVYHCDLCGSASARPDEIQKDYLVKPFAVAFLGAKDDAPAMHVCMDCWHNLAVAVEKATVVCKAREHCAA